MDFSSNMISMEEDATQTLIIGYSDVDEDDLSTNFSISSFIDVEKYNLMNNDIKETHFQIKPTKDYNGMDFLEIVITAFCPAIVVNSSTPDVSHFLCSLASPSPIFKTTFSSLGMRIAFLMPKRSDKYL